MNKTNNKNLEKYLVEFLGTLIFLTAILNAGNLKPMIDPAISIAAALAIVIFVGGGISGGHFNPAVSTMMYMDEKLSLMDYVAYVGAQILGGILALVFHRQVKQRS